jgi:uncharacterized protein YdaT
MPWQVKDVESKIKGLSDKQKEAWVSIANAALAECKKSGGKDCEGKAIRIANAKAKATHAESIVTDNFSDKKIRWKDIPTEETEEGLMVKGIPVFKTGTHKDNKYDENFIDKKLISQFDPEEDVPLQADHSDSYNATLGWVKNLYRKGKMLFADLLLVDDNAITRWNKGLMKKWSVGIRKDNGKLQEISAVAFPYVKEAAIHGDITEVGMARDYEVEEVEVATPLPPKEVIEIEAHKEGDAQSEEVNITSDEVDSLSSTDEILQWSDKLSVSIESNGSKKGTKLSVDGKAIKDPTEISFSMWGDSITVRYSLKKTSENGVTKTETYEYRNPSFYSQKDLPDSAFALVKNPIRDKSRDRVLQYKDASGKLDPALIRNAMASIDEIEGFSSESIDKAKTLLSTACKIAGKEGEEKMSEQKMTQEESILLKEAMEKEVKMAEDIKARDAEIAKLSEAVKESNESVKKFKVEKEVAELKAAGKILPAQEEKITQFMLKLEDEARAEFVTVLKDGKTAVELGEKSVQKSEKSDTGIDLDKMSVDEIDAAITKYAKESGVPFDDARDIFYEKHTKPIAE